MRRETIANLETLIAGGEDRQGGGTGPIVVLCHGYGANAEDLAGLWRLLEVPREVRFAFPEAPIDLPGMGFSSRAWWDIDLGRFDALMRGEIPLSTFLEERPPGLEAARNQLSDWLSELGERLSNPDLSRTVLGGFSQGAMLVTELTLSLSAPTGGLVLLSGTLLSSGTWSKNAHARARFDFFQSHGRRDPLLPFVAAEALHALLTQAGHRGVFVPFGGGHEIPADVISRLGRFLTALPALQTTTANTTLR